MNLGKTTYERGMEQGRREVVCEILESIVGVLSKTTRDKLQTLPIDQVRELGREIVRGKSLAEFGLEDAPAR